MRTNRRALFFFSAFCTLIFSGLLMAAPGVLPAAPKKDGASGKNVPAKNVPEPISGNSQDATVTLPDPKRPGKLLYELRYKSGSAQSDASGFHGKLTTVWARLYQAGAASAVLTAPRASAGGINKQVVVTGAGVVVMKSLTEPGTLLKADTVVWYASSGKIVATGHVYYHNGKTGATATGPHAVGYTALKSVVITGGGHATMQL